MQTVGPFARDLLLSLHILAIACWIGGGFTELWLGRRLLADPDSAGGAMLVRLIYRLDLFVFAATLVAFGTGLAMTILLGWGFFTNLWLGLKQAIMLGVLVIVAGILRPALRMGAAIDALPPGPGVAGPGILASYRRLEPWYLIMRAAAVLAVVLAVTRPVLT